MCSAMLSDAFDGKTAGIPLCYITHGKFFKTAGIPLRYITHGKFFRTTGQHQLRSRRIQSTTRLTYLPFDHFLMSNQEFQHVVKRGQFKSTTFSSMTSVHCMRNHSQRCSKVWITSPGHVTTFWSDDQYKKDWGDAPTCLGENPASNLRSTSRARNSLLSAHSFTLAAHYLVSGAHGRRM
jgi:hypothetical protein